ncbi:glucose-1-phosphate cytidylyltransferase [candidate division WOR-1 bacterium RIFOXYA12_FULL_43_27]|uniref:Glucose-1-phosphate cytidylyltransferase n=1 Tax=candidate division WOR-1 bacterium RIFOXYC2_FULL_46_14 TaxID=1802587 RepID=A0A1F4U429_UNCSA|nr:MAG: glucose-1-phosphate cytidylyltransferase [candidate division WOR-1 bacterium RIFOXYA12_FULL_43_27]OGC20921.1 MAG: glucose-1-phosphate cytidylyltransferase [candidate division WOR-1 bacterium RIFOXYB2_FULL_46_45]OGC32318.1 MAG: glucose-1-phosphate cytidylyltransferase [candidate division WOR-1 bacterium RIFOXYA2_FULL_46_56]OGC39617.1 MAG: glucose-1-phosphate cytidylyltransferase [candidate division WOR-1 bacterium RIFOXYC2_FULL_46_14]
MSRPKVVILCGGKGTRLREETEIKPKPLVEIGGRPILWHIMKIYAHFGYNDFILCLGYKGQMIKEYFYNYHILMNDFTINLDGKRDMILHNFSDEINWKITLVDTGLDSLKGARIKKIEKYIDGDNFLLTYGDGVANVNIAELIDFHNKHGKVGTLTGVRPPSRFGDLIIDNGRVTNFTEKPQASAGMINGGFFVLNRKLFEYLSADKECDFELGALERLAEAGELMVYPHKGSWECMDTFRETKHLDELWNQNKAFWKVWK